MKILAIDDNRDNLTALMAVVSERLPAAKLLTALNGARGLELARTEDPDVILLDIVMPGMDGYAVCRKLKEDGALQSIPVLFLTALKTDRDSRVKALEAGAEGFLSKPFDAVELTVQIQAMAKIKAAALMQRDANERLSALVAERTAKLQQSQTAMLNLLEDLKAENEARRRSEKEAREQSEELSRSRAELKAIYDHSPVMLCVVDESRSVLYANPTFARFTGVLEEDLKGGHACGIFGCINAADHPSGCGFGPACRPCTLRVAMEDTFATGVGHHNVEYHATFERAGGRREVTLLGSTALIQAAGEKRLLLCLHDITERKQAEMEKARLEAQLQQAQKMESVGRLAGGVAHDFNNMLGVILGNTEIALGELPPNAPLVTELLEIRKAAERSADLTRQLLAFARKQTVTPKVLNLSEIVDGMFKMLRRLIGEHIDLVWTPKPDLWQIRVDPSQVDQILANLCVNARDAIVNVGRVMIETGNCVIDEENGARHGDFSPGDYVMLAVSDNGCGMDQETQAHLFEPFFTTKDVGQGTGLGLATVYGIVKQNSGHICVYSEKGIGTTFKVFLPRYVNKQAQAQLEAVREPVRRGHETILLVEDEQSMLRLIKRIIERLGYTVLAARSPGEAIRLATEYSGPIHLLVTDVIMPEMNGRQLARSLLTFCPNLKRLFMSGYTADVIAHHGVLDAGVHFIQKPMSMSDLAAKLREALDSE